MGVVSLEEQSRAYLSKIDNIPPLSEAEELELLTAWKQLGDLKARNRVIEANLRLVPPIAQAVARRFGFVGAKVKSSFVPEFFGVGSLALVQAANHFSPSKGHPFANYARRVIRRDIVRSAKMVRSAVDRPHDEPVPIDMYLDNNRPDPVEPYDYCGARSRPGLGGVRLRPWPNGWEVKFQRESESLGATIFDLRREGLTLEQTAAELGMSVTTVWRRQQAYMALREMQQ